MGIPVVAEFLQVFLKNPILAWFTIVFVLFADTTSGVNVSGTVITTVFNFIGVNVEVQSLHLLIIVAFTPILRYAVEHSGN